MYKLVLCWRYLLTRYLALVCIVSVMLGVATLIVVNSVMAGFSTKLRDRLHGLLSDIDIERSGSFYGIDNPDEKMERIRRDPFLSERVAAMAPTMEVFSMLQYDHFGETILKPARLMGVNADRARLGGFAEYLQDPQNQATPSFELRGQALEAWQFSEAQQQVLNPEPAPRIDRGGLPPPLPPEPGEFRPTGIMIGYALAHARVQKADDDGNPVFKDGKPVIEEICVLPIGSEVVLTTVSGQGLKPVSFRCVVVDYVKTEMSEYDGSYIYMALGDLQRLRAMHNRVTNIQIKLKDYERDKAEVAGRLGAMFPTCSVLTWEQKQGPLLAAISIERNILNILLFMIIGVAGFGILAIFSMIVVEKTRDIGVLKALGASNAGVMKIFLGYGLLLGTIGALLGAALGVWFTVKINAIEGKLTDWTGQQIFDRTIYYFKDIPTDIQPASVALIALGSVLIAVVFSILPALRAAMLHPVRPLNKDSRRNRPMHDTPPLLSATNLHKTYRKHAVAVPVLTGLDVEVHPGEFLSVVGASGSGKSTLLHLLGTLDAPDEGRIYLEGRRIDNVPAGQRDALRNRTFGFIFQFYHLLPELTALENVLVPQMIEHSVLSWWGRRRELKKRGAELLERVGLGHRLKHRPRELSGGEMQRAAIARALVNRPRVLLADEPTGNLDADTGAEIVRLLRDLNRQEGLTIVMVTHNLELVGESDRVVRLVSGRVEEAQPPAALAAGAG